VLRTKLIKMHSRRPRDTPTALALYDEMRCDGVVPDAVCCNICLAAAGGRQLLVQPMMAPRAQRKGQMGHASLPTLEALTCLLPCPATPVLLPCPLQAWASTGGACFPS
jgi:hypothetical protein